MGLNAAIMGYFWNWWALKDQIHDFLNLTGIQYHAGQGKKDNFFAIKKLYFGTQELVSRFPTILDQQVIPL